MLTLSLFFTGLIVNFGSSFSSSLPVTINANATSAVISQDGHVLYFSLGKDYGTPKVCSGSFEGCITWGIQGPLLTIIRTTVNKFKVEVSTIGSGASLHMNLHGKHLYGGPPTNHWPAETAVPASDTAYVTGMGTIFGSPIAVAERSWFTSDGEALFVDFSCHLFYSLTPDKLSLSFENKAPYPTTNQSIKFEWCVTNNAKNAFACKPQQGREVPKQMISKPIWSTWVRFGRDISQDKILKMANEVFKYNFPISTLEIDDKWETCYGNHEWDLSKFPNPRKMVEKLKQMNLLVTLWVHPFINSDCAFLNDSAKYMVSDPKTGNVGIISWWNGIGGLINITDPAIQNWFQRRLKSLKLNYGLSGFKFDAGEAKYIFGLMNGLRSFDNPNSFTYEYVYMAAEIGIMNEVRVGSGNADTSIFQRLQDRNSFWESDLMGLQSILPNVLTLNALGYPAIIPDMVGGNMYEAEIDEELFVRWLQLNTFLPVIQFSVPPWTFSNKTTEHALELCSLHEKYADKIVAEIGNSDANGRRAISPVWWLDPHDETALTTDSEFLLGEDILVAPVVEKSAISRDIYLPPGTWADGNNGSIYTGPVIIKSYPAPLYILPYFLKQENKEVFLIKSF